MPNANDQAAQLQKLQDLVESAEMRIHLDATAQVAASDDARGAARGRRDRELRPWEDVWLGQALERAASVRNEHFAVDIGPPFFSRKSALVTSCSKKQ